MKNNQFILTQVEVIAPSSLQLTFADGKNYKVNLANIIAKHTGLKPLEDPAIFQQAQVGEWGSSVIWVEDDNLELAADNLRARAIEQAGGYSHELIWNWMAKHNLNLDTASAALGLSRRMLAYYRSGEKTIPRTVALALLGWEVEQKKAA